MITKYYLLDDDLETKARWYLNGLKDGFGRELDSRDFTYGTPVDLGPPLRITLDNENILVDVSQPLTVAIRKKGKPFDFTYADFDIPVATKRLGKLLQTIAGEDIQRIPVKIENENEEYEIINVISRKACIDTENSEIMWWNEEDGRPDKTGQPRMVTKLAISPEDARESHFLRPKGWEVVIVVSDVVKQAFEAARVTGVIFRDVTNQ